MALDKNSDLESIIRGFAVKNKELGRTAVSYIIAYTLYTAKTEGKDGIDWYLIKKECSNLYGRDISPNSISFGLKSLIDKDYVETKIAGSAIVYYPTRKMGGFRSEFLEFKSRINAGNSENSKYS